MIRKLNLKGKNKIEKVIKNFKTRMAVYIYIYIVYCHLENKLENYNNITNKDRTILKRKNSIGLSLCVLCEKISHKHQRAGP